MLRHRAFAAALAMLTFAPAGSAEAVRQRNQTPAPTVLPNEPAPPAEVQKLFEAYTLSQAQEVLQLTDEQYARFVPPMQALQTMRRRHMRQRMDILRELARLSRAEGTVEESRIRDRLKALEEHDKTAAADVARAYAAIDEVLELRQQARFRVFEQNIERRKMELLMRARQPRPRQSRRP